MRLTMVQLPGLNTPQFDWVLHRLPRQRRGPCAPVYQPEVAARRHRRAPPRTRGASVLGRRLARSPRIVGNAVAPGLAGPLSRARQLRGPADRRAGPATANLPTTCDAPLAVDRGAQGVRIAAPPGHGDPPLERLGVL